MENQTQSRIAASLRCRVQPCLPDCGFDFTILQMVVVFVRFSPFFLSNEKFIVEEHARGKNVRIGSCLDAYTQL
jgi:hypothetical protein